MRGLRVHVLPAGREAEVARVLEQAGFAVSTLEGRACSSAATFFAEAARGLRLPEYFGRNWDAFDECLRALGEGQHRRLAVLWRDADRSFRADPQTVLDAVQVFSDAGRELAGEDPFTQLEVFLFGEGFARLTREPGDQPR
jgi:RNAse (barnase) inhibitor barstar